MATSSHPMIPVPQAIRTVLTKTAEMMNEKAVPTEKIPVIVRTSENEGEVPNNSSYPSQLVGRIAAETIKAIKGYPLYTASVMDGYAINIDGVFDTLNRECEDYSKDMISAVIKFKVVERVYAGASKDISDDTVSTETSLEAVYVTTGAPIPSQFDCVVPIEQVDDSAEAFIRIDRTVLASAKKNQWVRLVGCDITPNTTILSKGQLVETVHVGLLTQIAIHEVEVNCMPRVGILSTGNELVSQFEGTNGASQYDGMIPDANGPVILSLLMSYGSCCPVHLGIAEDDNINRLTLLLRESILQNDVVITTGGISMGEMDCVEEALVKNLGCQLHFGRLHMKPGKPTSFFTAHLDGKQTLIFALPGNPVSAMVCAELLVRPCLDMIHSGIIGKLPNMVENAIVHSEVNATLMDIVKLDMERPEYHRVSLTFAVDEKNGLKVSASSTGVQRSSRLMSMCEVDGLLLLPQGIKGGKDTSNVGENYQTLLVRRPTCNAGFFSGIQVKDSLHLGDNAPLAIGLIEVLGSIVNDTNVNSDQYKDLSRRLLDAIGPNDAIVVQSKKTNLIFSLQDQLKEMGTSLDLIVVVGTDTSFRDNLEISNEIKPILTKNASAMALAILQGASENAPLATLSEPVAGYTNFGSLLISTPNEGLEGAFGNVKYLIRQALSKLKN
mmetsp:Transcript_6729/g.9653  ORF Transcript_6729/g.9653 Transcript_6729/m.9653 type:complete len:668 (-) Transcript_6729:316-2319(-)